MPRRADSFARALKDAEKSLEKALAEKIKCHDTLNRLHDEIPRLQAIITSLSGKVVMPSDGPNPSTNLRPVAVTGEHRAVTSADTPPLNLGPEDLAKWYTDRDLSQVGSILPPKPVAPSAPVSEDELLPEDFAVGKRK